MNFKQQAIKGLFLIKPSPFIDKRGLFRRAYCARELKLNNINFKVKQINISENKKKQTLRGFHYQQYPYGEDKILTCVRGEIHNIVIDMRKKSKTFMCWKSFKLNETNRLALLVPKGCANAYLTLQKQTMVLYFHSQYFKPGFEKRVKYNDSRFNFDWPLAVKFISIKDDAI